MLGVQEIPQKSDQKLDKSLCVIHKLKKTFFCEECLYELCFTCREKHERNHPIKFIEETAKYVIQEFKGSLDEFKSMRSNLHDASNEDPTTYSIPEGSIDVLD